MAEQPKYFDIEDYNTGKRYRVEAYDPDATFDEAVEYLSTVPDEELSQYEYNPTPAPQQVATAPKPSAPVAVPVEDNTAFNRSMENVLGEARRATRPNALIDNQGGFTSRPTVEFVSRPDIAEQAQRLWDSGVRDAKVFESALKQAFPDQTFTDPQGNPTFTPEYLKQVAAYEESLKRNQQAPRNLFLAQENTLQVDPEAPETAADAFFTGAWRTALQSSVLMTRGIAGWGASLAAEGAEQIGADSSAEKLRSFATDQLLKYIDANQTILYENPRAVESYEDVTLDNFTLYAADAVAETLVSVAGGGGAGILGREAAKRAIRKSVSEAVEDLTLQIGNREIAQGLVDKSIAQIAMRRGAIAGTTGFTVGQETAGTFADTFQETGELAPLSSLTAGVASGAFEAILPVRFLDNLGITADVTRQAFAGKLGKMMAEGVKSASVEMLTEAVQTFIGNMPAQYIKGEAFLTPEVFDQMVEAAIRGAIGGGAIGAAGGAQSPDYRGPRAVAFEQPDLPQTIFAPSNRKGSKKYNQQVADARAATESLVSEITSGWSIEPNVQVLDSFEGTRFADDALGVYTGEGNVVLNVSGLTKEAKRLGVTPDTIVRTVMFHESLGHFGLDLAYGEQLDTLLYNMYENGAPEVRRMVQKWVAQNQGAYTDAQGNVDYVRATEEVLAEMAQEGDIPRSMLDELVNFVKDFARRMNVNLKYSEREIRTIVAMGQSKVRDGTTSSTAASQGIDKYMYVGEVGAQNLPNLSLKLDAERSRSDKFLKDWDNTIQDYIDEFGPGGESRLRTGWFLAPDGEWRYEISDAGATFKLDMVDFQDSQGESIPQKLEDVMEHPTLFALYPELRDYTITRIGRATDLKKTIQGWHNASQRLINITPYAVADPASILLHEVQHAVQSIEGFAVGGDKETAIDQMSPEELTKGGSQMLKSLRQEIQLLSVEYDAAINLLSLPEYRTYLRISEAEIEKYRKYKEVQARLEKQGVQGKDLFNYPEYEDAANAWRDAGNVTYRARAALQNAMGLPLQMSDFTEQQKTDFYRLMSLVSGEQLSQEGLKLEAAVDKAKETYDDLQVALALDDYRDIARIAKEDPKASFEAYEHLFGEIEARDVEQRRKMDEFERSVVHPYTFTDKTDVDSAIIVKDRDMLFAEQESNTRPEITRDSIAVSQDRGPSFNADGKSVPQFVATAPYGEVLAVVRRRPFESNAQARERVLDQAMANYDAMQNDPEVGGVNRILKDKYARPRPSMRNVRADPVRIEDLTAQELADSQRAFDILNGVVENYAPSAMPMEDLRERALEIELPPELIVERLAEAPGSLSRELFAYDVAAQKLHDHILDLYQLVETGQADANDKLDLVKALLSFRDLTAKIFGFQSEVGRALRALQEVQFTFNNSFSLREALKDLPAADAAFLAGLEDPSTFDRFARRAVMEMQRKTKTTSKGDRIVSVLNTPRSIMASFDLSAPLRQGLYFISRPEYWNAWVEMAKTLDPRSNKDKDNPQRRGETIYTQLMKEITTDPDFTFMSKGGLFFSSIDGPMSAREEKFQSDLAQAVPGVRASEAAYSTFLNRLRKDLFVSYLNDLERAGYNFRKDENGQPKDINSLTPEEVEILKGLAKFINAGTGRGNLPKFMQGAGPFLNALLFSPGLVASRVFLIGGGLTGYANLPKPIRKEALKQSGIFFSSAFSVLGLLSLIPWAIGEEEEEPVVEFDPRSSNFLKVRYDNVYFDVMGGMAQYGTLFTRGLVATINFAIANEEDRIAAYKTSTGELQRHGETYRDSQFIDDFIKFSRGKLSPNASFVYDFYKGKTVVGEPFELGSAISSRAAPLLLQDWLELIEAGHDGPGQLLAVPGIFGIGVNAYTPYPLDPEREVVPPEKFEMSDLDDGENYYLRAEGGVAYLKPHTQRLWGKVTNLFFQENIQEVVTDPRWDKLSRKEKAEFLKEAELSAKADAKEYMIELMLPQAEEEIVQEEVTE